MTFVETDTTNQERFTLLLLDPGEIYFEDFSVYYYPSCSTEDESIRKKQRGHLKVCSKSVVFVPKEVQYPILRYSLKSVKGLEEWSGDLMARLAVKDKTFRIKASVVVEMMENNIVAPYIFRKNEVVHTYTLNYATVEDCIPQMCQLHRASTLPPAEQIVMINSIVYCRQNRVKFNTSWLEDLYEKIILETRADRITPLATNPGRVMLTSSRLYFQPFNNIDRLPVLKIRLKDMKRIIKRRFLLRQIALEIICSEAAPVQHLYLSLKSQFDRDTLYNRMLSQSDVKLEDTGQEDMTIKWQSGYISNYEYLLYLNSLADRSFNDLTQYPVMPWIVTEFKQDELDLDDPKTFRDLSKPIGALNTDRLIPLKERYDEMPEPKFLYGSHYSTPGYVLFYLARIAYQYVLCLQHGKFDHPDRMLNSLTETWQNCLNGAADFKELIPEFYEGSGEFLIHKGVPSFGFKQDGRPVGDVELPKWAKSPSDCIKQLREALECEHISKHIHEWIDLVFGYKQTGDEAEKADNLFYYLTYEGAIDLESINDPNERASLEIQIMEFGQTPKQLFSTPHPRRYTTKEIPRGIHFNDTFSTLSPENPLDNDNKSDHGASSTIEQKPIDLSTLEKLQPHFKHSLHKDTVTDVRLSADGKNIISVSQDCILKIYSLEEQRQLRSIPLSSMALSSCQVMPDDKTIVVGSWDNCVYFYSIEYGRVLDTLTAHDDAVSCLCWQSDVLYTASWDSSVKLWKFKPPSANSVFRTAELQCQLDHDSAVTSFVIDEKSGLLVSGTNEGHICLWDLPSSYILQQQLLHMGQVHSVLLNAENRRIISSGDDCYLKVLDIDTGTEIFSKSVQEEILCLCLAGNGVLGGTESGKLHIWDLDKGQMVKEIREHKAGITSIRVDRSGQLLTGSKDKTVILWKPNS